MAANTDSAQPAALVVEDEYLVSLSLVSQLEDIGFRVVGPAARLADACDLASREPLTVAVLDINLAGEMSWPVARILQARKTPFLFLSGYSASSGVRPPDLLSTPMLPKPFSEAQLRAALSDLLRASAPSRPLTA